MRNLLEYPITTTEIVEALTQACDYYNACNRIGGIDGICIEEAIRRVQSYDELKAQADQLVNNYKALSAIVAEFCPDNG